METLLVPPRIQPGLGIFEDGYVQQSTVDHFPLIMFFMFFRCPLHYLLTDEFDKKYTSLLNLIFLHHVNESQSHLIYNIRH